MGRRYATEQRNAGAAARRLCRLIVIGTLLAAPLLYAQVPVIESRDVRSGTPRAQPAPNVPPSRSAEPARAADATSSGGGSMAELFYQLQLLQVEVQELRGLLEEQAYQIERLTRLQREQYLDLDRRLLALREGDAAGPRTGRDTLQSDLVVPRSIPTPGAGDGPRTETEAYAHAFDLTNQRRFPEAIDAFNQLIADYPNGQYTANAHYWLGELYMALPEPRYDDSQAAFERVIQVYPTNQKVPDALYKIGVIHHRQGDVARAREVLQRVQREHAGSSAAQLAADYAAALR
jgi:tol-pal system protein YbgF